MISRLLRVELRRLAARRLYRGVFLGVLGLIVLGMLQASANVDSAYSFTDSTPGLVQGIGVLAAVASFVVGASAGGAEWAAGTMQALLFWEPRRPRVLLSKMVAVALLVMLLSAAAQLLAVTGNYLVASSQGTAEIGPGFWGEVASVSARAFALAAFLGTLGFSVAAFTRSTAGALGVAFVYLSILENLLRIALPRFSPYALGTGVAGWMAGGITVPGGSGVVHVSQAGAGMLLLAYGVLFGGLATVLFARRDVT